MPPLAGRAQRADSPAPASERAFPAISRRKKADPKVGFFIAADITSKRPKQPQQLEQLEQPQQLEQLEQLEQPQQLEQLEQEQQQALQRLQEQQVLLLFCCKQPEQQPTGRRSAGIFSWVFLKYFKNVQQCCDE